MAGAGFMRISRLEELPRRLRGGVVAIGNFDGIHRGHQAVLGRALAEAAERGEPTLMLTFEPHPRALFRPDEPMFRLTPAPLKARIAALIGLDCVVELPFTHELAATEPEDFVIGVLDRGLGVRHAVTGFDFHFGKDRRGGPAYLMEAGARHDFDVTLVDALRDETAEVISSSRIRDLLREGDAHEAALALGYRYTVEAEVSGGRKLGRTLGFPTANMALPPGNGLRHGIYAVKFRRASGTVHDGVASFGRRPTVEDGGATLLETYLFDMEADLYGEACAVSFFGFLRGEAKFDGLEPLKAQMKRDEAEARALLANARPLSELDTKLVF